MRKNNNLLLLTSVFLFQGPLTQDSDGNLERKHSHMSSPLTEIKSVSHKKSANTNTTQLNILPVIDVEQPVEREIETERDVDLVLLTLTLTLTLTLLLRLDGLVEREEDGDHVAHVQHPVVLASEAVSVERLHGHVQMQKVH